MSDLLTILEGDALERLRGMESESVQCCVTSPPYWGLRDYGTGTWEGGDAACDHVKGEMRRGVNLANSVANTRGGAKKCAEVENIMFGAECGKCGALRVDKQMGLERTPEEFVGKMVAVFEEVRRVLKADGTCWVNLGDSYATGAGAVGDCPGGGAQGERAKRRPGLNGRGEHQNSPKHGDSIMMPKTQPNRLPIAGLKPKDLVGIPWRVAFGLQAAGWYLRSDIIWAKPNPMPESVTDRPTKAHEYLFLLSKSERYYYDAEAIKEPVTGGAHARGDGVNPKARYKTPDGWDTTKGNGGHGSIHREGREDGATGYERKGKAFGPNSRVNVSRTGSAPQSRQNESFSAAVKGLVNSRNKRSVWSIPTFAFPEAHFATFPPDLVKPCVLAGSRVGDVVLDPFGGTGTTAQVAIELGRRAVVIELNPAYLPMIRQRCAVTPGLGI